MRVTDGRANGIGIGIPVSYDINGSLFFHGQSVFRLQVIGGMVVISIEKTDKVKFFLRTGKIAVMMLRMMLRNRA